MSALKRWLPRSLIGQIALVMAVALLVAQAINFSLIFSERQRVSRAQIEGPAVGRFVLFAQRAAATPPDARPGLPERGRRSHYAVSDRPSLPAGESDPQLVERLTEAASASDIAFREMRAVAVDAVLPPRWGRGDGSPREVRIMLLSAQLADGSWVNARIVTRRPNPWLMLRPLVATLLIYLIILAAMIWVAVRLARPLRDLAAAAERFEGRGEAPQVVPRGPADLSHAIIAFNAMSARVSAMLDEKDRMLGAIGHDLRTPLASLRIRAEIVEPEEERLRIIATIEEMTAMLDDTLALARSGRAVEPARTVDIAALADATVEEFRALGHQVEMENGGRLTAKVQPGLLRRALRNLIENGIKYGAEVRVAVREAGDQLAIEVTDRGPGIPESELAKVQEAFYRVEPSRSRETGGSGLGLTLARAAAQAHGGSLELINRPEGGLCARILLPRDGAGR